MPFPLLYALCNPRITHVGEARQALLYAVCQERVQACCLLTPVSLPGPTVTVAWHARMARPGAEA